MPVRIVCSACKAAYQVSETLLGKKVKCKQCDQIIPVVAATSPPAVQSRKPVPRPPEVEPDSEPEAPKRAPVPASKKREAPAPKNNKAPATRRAALDETPKKPRRPKGHLTPVMTIAATLAIMVLMVSAGLGAFFIYTSFFANDNTATPPVSGMIPLPGVYDVVDPPLIPYQQDLEAFYRAPEEPPIHRLVFAEPQMEPDESSKPGPMAAGPLVPEVLQKIKEATVYLRVKSSQGESEGSGFFGVEPGIILTNAHVIGMLDPNAPLPTSIQVVRNKGERNETSFPAKVVAVDQSADLALLSVPKQGMPQPLTVKSALNMQETQTVYVAGFPLGELPGKSITINKYELSSLKKEKGILDKLQVHGDMLPGNSGGPLLDGTGDVVGVCVSILTNTRINFAIPGDKVNRFLNGRFAGLTFEAPVNVDGKLQVPVVMRLLDPLGRVSEASLDYWVGKPGAERPPSRTAPEVMAGDGPRQTLALEVKHQGARGDWPLPTLPEGQVYWVQPHWVDHTGAKVWLSAHEYEPPPPVARKPVKLSLNPSAERPMLLERWSTLHFADPQGRDHRIIMTLETRFKERGLGPKGPDLSMQQQFTAFKEGASVDGQTFMTGRMKTLGPQIAHLGNLLVVDTQGKTKSDEFDYTVLKGVVGQPRVTMLTFREDLKKLQQGLEIPLPAGQIQPGQTWKAQRSVPADGMWKSLDILPIQVFEAIDTDTLEVTYTFTGVRSKNGADQAVIPFRGQVLPQPGRGPGSGGQLIGTAVVDLATGQVVEEEVTSEANIELVLFNRAVIKARGTVLTRLRQE